MVEHGIRTLTAALLAAAFLMVGCADQQKTREEELSELLAWLPGKYDNSAQVAHDAQQSGHPAHEAIALVIMPVHAPRLGHHVFYIQESAANDAQRIMSSRMFSFDVDAKNGIVGLTYEFNDPARWREAAHHAEFFDSLVAEDTSSVGCEFLWKKKGDELFTATHDPKRCHSLDHTPGATVAELGPNNVSFGDYKFLRSRR
jgi:hypothetical protein